MAEFTLATQRVQQGRPGKLSPQLLPAGGGAAANLRAGQIDPNAGNIGFTPAPIPKMVEDQTSKGIQAFMGATAEAAFKYEQREATFIANDAALKYGEAARRAYGGYEDANGNFVPGYSHAQGDSARLAYPTFQQKLDESMQDMLDKLEPRVKQKAILQMQSTKNQYMAKGATHRVTQMKLAEAEQRTYRKSAVVRELALDPTWVIPLDKKGTLKTYNKITGKNIVQEFFDNYISMEEAQKDWADTLRQVTEMIYHERHDVAGARQFLQHVAGPQMIAAGQIGPLTTLQSSLRGWELKEERNSLSRDRLELAQLEKSEKDYADYIYKKTAALMGTDKQPPEAEMNDIIFETPGNTSKLIALKNKFYGGRMAQADPIAEADWTIAIKTTAYKDKATGIFMVSAPRGVDMPSPMPLSGAWEGDSRIAISGTSMANLKQLAEGRMDPEGKVVTQLMKRIEDSHIPPYGGDYTKKSRQPQMTGYELSLRYLHKEYGYTATELEIMAMEQNMFNPATYSAAKLSALQAGPPIIGTNRQPSSEEDVGVMARENEVVKTSDPDLYNQRKLQLLIWKKSFQAAKQEAADKKKRDKSQ